ncbi:MAG TPA: glycosyltransferase family 9 protein [Chloroflexota bacterium]
MLLTTPAVALLRASLPDAHLVYVVGPWSAEVARAGPPVDEVRTLAYPGFTRRPRANILAPYLLLAREAARLRREGYDLAVVFRPDHWWGALLSLAAGAPLRIGGHGAETTPLLTHTSRLAGDEHAAERALAMAHLALQAVGVPSAQPETRPIFEVTRAAQAEAEAFWARHRLDRGTVVALHPNAGARLKSWPTPNWARLADALMARGLGVLLTGAPGDGPLLRSIAALMARPPELAFGQSLNPSAALYARCALVITVDSGAGHLAAAVGTPTVRLYGPAPANVFGPWPPTADQHLLVADALECVPCGHVESPPCGAMTEPACMLALSVEQVLDRVRAQLPES